MSRHRPRSRQNGSRSDAAARQAAGATQGWQYDLFPSVPGYERLGRPLAGLLRLRGWRRVVVRLAALVALLVILAVIVSAAARL